MAEKEVSCHNCVGACCQNIRMALNSREDKFMRKGGTKLLVIFPAISGENWGEEARALPDNEDPLMQKIISHMRTLSKGEGLYGVEGRCGYLVEKDGWNQCSAHEDPERPKICQEFQPGSKGCVELFNKRAGVKVEITKKFAPVKQA